MIHEHDVRARLAALLRHAISIESFRRWIVDESWNMHSDSSACAIDLVSDVQMLIAEHDDRAISDDALLRALVSLLNNIDVEVVRPVAVMVPKISRRLAASPNVVWLHPPSLRLLPVSA